MDQATHNRIVSFIWGIADDVLRDLFRRGKYPDVILPMCVIRRMDAVLEPAKQKVLDTHNDIDVLRERLQKKATATRLDRSQALRISMRGAHAPCHVAAVAR
jgi:type I restriction enzyme M protein